MNRNKFASGKKEPKSFRIGAFAYAAKIVGDRTPDTLLVQLKKSEMRGSQKWWLVHEDGMGHYWRPESELSL